MRVLVLTGSRHGTAAHHLPLLLQDARCEVAMVVLNEGKVRNKARHCKRKLKKILRIGICGSINGIRMRKWYQPEWDGAVGPAELESTCRTHGIPFHTVPHLGTQRARELFKQADADLGISLGNGYIPPSIFAIPKHGMINIHHEVLPDYQNAPSVIWQIHNMSRSTGYTIHRINKGIDTGEILYQEHIPIFFAPTLRQTLSRTMTALLDASAAGLVKTVGNFQVLLAEARPQGPGMSYTTPSFRQYLRICKNFKRLLRETATR